LRTAQFVKRGTISLIVPQFLSNLLATPPDATRSAKKLSERYSHGAAPYL
jgi:hypothetical protein